MREWSMVSKIAQTILIMSLTGGVMTAALCALKPIIKNRLPKAAQYYMWVMVVAAFLIPFSAFVSLPADTPTKPAQEIIRNNVKSTAEWQEQLSIEKYDTPYEELEDTEKIDISYREIGLQKGDINNNFIICVICVGVFGFLIELVQYFAFVGKMRKGRIEAHDNEAAMLDFLCGSGYMPRLYRSTLAPTAMLIGIFRPVIYLPDCEYSGTQLANVLRHELTHMRRGDVFIKWLTAFAVKLHWFNPLAYLLRREIDHACELSCDEAVIAALDTEGKQSYGDTLIAMAADHKMPKMIVSTTMCEEKKSLKARLGAIMSHKGTSKMARMISFVLVAAVLCGAVVLGAKSVPKTTSPVLTLYVESAYGGGWGTGYRYDDEGAIYLSDTVKISATYRDNTGTSSVKLYSAESDKPYEKSMLGGGGRNTLSPDNVENTDWWDLAGQYPDGFNGYIWAVVSDSERKELESEKIAVVYDPTMAQAYLVDAFIGNIEHGHNEIKFAVPEEALSLRNLEVHITGRAVYEDDFSRSFHFYEGERFESGKVYTIDYDENFRELIIDISYTGRNGETQNMTYDLLAPGVSDNTPKWVRCDIPVTLYTYSGTPDSPAGERLYPNDEGITTLPSQVVVEIDIPEGYLEYDLIFTPEGKNAFNLRTVISNIGEEERANMKPEVRFPDYFVWDVTEYFPNGVEGTIGAIGVVSIGSETECDALSIVFEPEGDVRIHPITKQPALPQ